MAEITRLNSADNCEVGEGGTEDLEYLSNICWSETSGDLRLSEDIVEFMTDKTP